MDGIANCSWVNDAGARCWRPELYLPAARRGGVLDGRLFLRKMLPPFTPGFSDVAARRDRSTAATYFNRHHHHGAPEEGPAERLATRHAPAAAGAEAAGGPRLHAAVCACARGSRAPGIMVEAHFHPHRHRSDAGRLHRGRRLPALLL